MKSKRVPLVFNLNKIPDIRVPIQDQKYVYHGGGPYYRGPNSKLNEITIQPNQASIPNWMKTEAERLRGELRPLNKIRKELDQELLSLGNRKTGNKFYEKLYYKLKNLIERGRINKKGKELSRQLAEITKKEWEIEKKYQKKIENGTFQSPYGKITNQDLMNVAIRSFAEGPMSQNIGYLKTKAFRPEGREEYELANAIMERKGEYRKIFKKPIEKITEEEMRGEIGKGRIFENDILFLKMLNNGLTKEEIQEAKNRGIIGETDEKIFNIFNGPNEYKHKVVFTSHGINSSFSGGDRDRTILVEAKKPDTIKGKGYPLFFGKMPSKSIRSIYITEKRIDSEQLKNRVNVVIHAKDVIKQNKELLRSNASNNQIASQLNEDPRLVDLARKILKRDKSLTTQAYPTKIPTNEF